VGKWLYPYPLEAPHSGFDLMLFDSLVWTLCIYGWLAVFIFFGLIYILERMAQRLDKM